VTSGAFAGTLQAQVQFFAGNESRELARVFYYEETDQGFETPGQLSIDYGTPEWKAEYEDPKMMGEMRGKRWRFGSGLWTRLDTNVPLTFGSTTVQPGSYYVVLEYTQDQKMNLVLLDPKQIRDKHWDAFQADQTTGGTVIPLTWTKDNAKVDKMKITLTPDEKDPRKVALAIAWGPHLAKTDLMAKVGGA
jgi:hypothetical protein